MMTESYIREGDSAVMVQIAPHIFVNRDIAAVLGLIRPLPTPKTE
jgi:hypothetical protein